MAEKLKIAGLRLKIDGAAEFNKSITSINSELQLASARLSVTTEAFDRATPAVEQLAAKQMDLSAKLDAARKKGDQYKQTLESVKAQYGETSSEAMQAEAVVLKNEAAQIRLKNALDEVNRQLQAQQSGWQNLGDKLNNAGESLTKVGDKLTSVGKTLTTGVTAPIAAASVAAFKLASDMEESTNKVDVAFGASAESVKQFADTSLTNFGISKGAALDAAATFGDMATSMGLTDEAAANMSIDLVGLAGDLASFKNIDVEQAMTALSGVFTGETESLKTLGIVMTETQLEAYALEKGITDNVSTMSQAEKVTLRYQYVLDATKNSQGDFSRTSDGAANQMRIFTEGAKELGATFGEVLLPYGTKLVTKLNDIIKKFASLTDEQKENILKWAGIAAAIGPALLTFGKVSSAVGKIITTFGNLAKSISNAGGMLSFLTKSPIALAITGFAGLTTVVSGIGSFLDGLDTPLNNLRDDIDENAEVVNRLSEEFKTLTEKQQEYIDAGISETDYLMTLKSELDGLVDANGKIKEGYEERANFILSELSEATGVEVSQVNGIIQGYEDLSTAIDEAIVKKRAMVILEGKEEAYSTSLQQINELEQAYVDAYKNVEAAQAEYDKYGDVVHGKQLERAKENLNSIKESLGTARSNIEEYEAMSAEVIAGNFESVAEMYGYVAKTEAEITQMTIDESQSRISEVTEALEGQMILYRDYGDERNALAAEQAAEELAALVAHLQAMGVEVDEGTLTMLEEWQEYLASRNEEQGTKNDESIDNEEQHMSDFNDAIENGGETATATMNTAVQNILDAANSKISSFSSIGSSMMAGIKSGIDSGSSLVSAAIVSAVAGAVAAGRREAQINSPSKLFARELGAPISEGIAYGVDEKSSLLKKSITDTLHKAAVTAKGLNLDSIDINSRLKDTSSLINNPNAAAINNAYSYEYGGITIQNMVVREENDIKRIAKELFTLQRAANRGRGVVMP